MPLYFGGSSDAGQSVAARHADVYLTWGEPPDQVAEKIRAVRQEAAKYGRTLRFGIRLHVITRDTEEEAWAEAKRLLDEVRDIMEDYEVTDVLDETLLARRLDAWFSRHFESHDARLHRALGDH